MTNIFGNLTDEGLSEPTIPTFNKVESDVYDINIKIAYHTKAASGADMIWVLYDIVFSDGTKRNMSERLVVTNRNQENFYTKEVKGSDGKTTKKRFPLMGYSIINDICKLVTDQKLSEQSWEEKTWPIYNYEAGKEIPTKVLACEGLINSSIKAGIQKTIENKNKQVGTEWVPTAEEKITYPINKVFDKDSGLNAKEIESNETEPKEMNNWIERNKGKDRDARKVKNGEAGVAGNPFASNKSPVASTQNSLFSSN